MPSSRHAPRRGRRGNAIATLTTLVALLGVGVTIAQEPAAPGFGELVDVRLVNVEVWVTDSKGRPIRGLEASDFEVLEDGEPVEITHFTELAGDASPAESAPDPAPAVRAEAPAAPLAVPTVWPSHLVIYVDDLHLGASGRKRLIDDLRSFVDSGEAPAERVLVMRQEHDLYTEVPFGSSAVDIEDALDRIAERASRGARFAQEKRLLLFRLQELWRGWKEVAGDQEWACVRFVPQATAMIDLYMREARNRVNITMSHMTSVVSFLAGVPGVKTMLYLSDRFETTPGRDFVQFVQRLCPTLSLSLDLPLGETAGQDLVGLTNHANANRVTIYALQGSGLRTGSLMAADQRAVDPLVMSGFESAEQAVERDGMTMMASQTGGRAIFDTNRFDKALRQIRSEMDAYYSMGYPPPRASDGRRHKIEVKVRLKGAKVRHRLAYRDKLPDERFRERLLSALYLGQVTNPLGVRLGQGRVVGTSSGGYKVPLHIFVPPDRVAFLPDGDSTFARLRVQLLARGERGKRTADVDTVFQVERPPDGFDRPLDLELELKLEDGLHVVAVALRDEATLDASYVATNLVVGADASR